jgi:hypothetical protein
MTTTLTDVEAWTTPVVVPEQGDNHTSAICQVTPHQAHANRTAYIRARHNAFEEVRTAASGYSFAAGPTQIDTAVETIAVGANSATVKLDIAAADLDTTDNLIVYANLYIRGPSVANYDYICLYDNVGGAVFTRACAVLSTQTLTPYRYYPMLIAYHSPTAAQAANGLSIRIRNGSGSTNSLDLRVPWQISVYRLKL